MISFETFDKTIQKLKEIDFATQKIGEAFKLLDKDNSGYFSLGWIEQTITDLLKEAMDDKWDTVSYWVYELDFGKRGRNCITLKNGKKVSLITTRQVYDYVKKQK